MKLALILATLPAFASQLDRARELTQSGNYPAAQRLLTSVAKQAEADRSTATAAIVWSEVGAVSVALGNLHEAERAYRRCLDLRQADIHDADDARVRSSLGAVLARLGKYGEADAMLEIARATFEATLGPEHPDYGTVLNNLALLRRMQGHFADAAPLMDQALAILQRHFGPSHRATVIAMANLGLVRAKLGQGSVADDLSNRALTSVESLVAPDHPLLAQVLFLRADVLHLIGNKPAASAVRARAAQIQMTFLRDTGAAWMIPAEELRGAGLSPQRRL